jgi:hypothetical protein
MLRSLLLSDGRHYGALDDPGGSIATDRARYCANRHQSGANGSDRKSAMTEDGGGQGAMRVQGLKGVTTLNYSGENFPGLQHWRGV